MGQSDDPVIRVTLDDVEKVEIAPRGSATTFVAPTDAAANVRNWGNINAAEPDAPLLSEERGSLLLQGWFYLGAAGLLGAILGWGICEPHFMDGGEGRDWGNTWILPLTILLMLVAFALAESIVERSWKKAGIRLAMVVPMGLIFGFVFEAAANIVYAIGINLIASFGIRTWHNPAWWIARGMAWMVFGIAGGLVYGLMGKSAKKGKFGVIGGIIGAGLGGMLFDPIALWLNQAVLSRAVGFGLFGLATGAAMGFVESALKDRWLYVSAGPLAGKQFILYKPLTTLGSQQQCDIYLFKDASIAPQQATIELRGTQAYLRSATPIFVSGMPVQQKVLLNGEMIQIGRYAFKYNERHRS
jgi:hypothetical protein